MNTWQEELREKLYNQIERNGINIDEALRRYKFAKGVYESIGSSIFERQRAWEEMLFFETFIVRLAN